MFEVAEQPCRLRIRMSSELKGIDAACKLIGAFLQKLCLERYAFDVELLTREALINAIVHGNGNDRRKTIQYGISMEGDCLTIEVEDSGNGFNWPAFLQREPELTSECGRGVLLMREYSTGMAYNARGNRLVLSKLIS
jgi:serine/threonine-protein kinase RsbW